MDDADVAEFADFIDDVHGGDCAVDAARRWLVRMRTMGRMRAFKFTNCKGILFLSDRIAPSYERTN